MATKTEWDDEIGCVDGEDTGLVLLEDLMAKMYISMQELVTCAFVDLLPLFEIDLA